MWKGELAIHGEPFDPKQLNPLEPWHLHTQQVVCATVGTRTGIGAVEQVCIRPYAPAGFVDLLDGAKE